MNSSTQVVIIGAGPYGLSLAAHLKQSGVDTRIFGQPMLTWQTQMPRGMHLKSDGFGSNISDLKKSYTLGQFSSEINAPYHDTMIPVPLANFIAYGQEFQRRFVPHLDTQNVTHLERTDKGFAVTLESGEVVSASLVVIAVGISHFQYLPSLFDGLPEELVTHTASHPEPAKFAGKEVTVIGAGASALGLAGLMQEAGAKVSIIARRQKLKFGAYPTEKRSLQERLRHPMSELGPGWRSWIAQHFPHAFQMLPADLRVKIVRRALGPSGGYYSRDSVIGKTNDLLGCAVKKAEEENDRVKLTLDCNGTERVHVTDHVVCGTGYQINLNRLSFLPEELKRDIQLVGTAPALNRNFQSTVPGLFFIGPASANSFGPLMRFAAGARYTSGWLVKHLRRRAKTA